MKLSAKRIFSLLIVLAMALSLLPGIAMAADAYVKVTGLSDVTAGGQFVFVANGFAMDTTLQGNSKFNGIAVTPSGNTLSGSLPVWTVEAVSGGIAISVGGQYLGYSSSTNFKMQADPYTWTVSVGDNGFQIKSAATSTRGIFLQTSSSRFGAYSTTNTSGYVFDLELYKLPDGTPSCDHAYTSKVTTALTCTQDGVETYTCSKCGDTYTKTSKATGHNYVSGDCTKCDAVIVTDPAKIISEAYALDDGAALGYDSTLTGEIISVDEAFSSSYNNITVTIAVEGYEDQPIKCYRLTGTGADALAVGDIISVTGMIKNYKGTIEFDSGCKLGKVVSGGGSTPVAPSDPKQIVEDAYALAEGATLPYTATLTGVITEVGEYNEKYGDITVYMVVEGKEFQCYALKGEGVADLAVGDTITVTGTIKNYYGTIEFDKPNMDAVVKASGGVTVSGAVVTGAEGNTTVELIAEDAVVATATASGKEGTYSIENVAAGTYTLKVSKENHVTREYTVTVGTDALTQDVKIHLIGDIDGNGKVNVGDVSKLNSHIKGTSVLTDEYMVLCANVNGGSLNMGDVSVLYAHIKGTRTLY